MVSDEREEQPDLSAFGSGTDSGKATADNDDPSGVSPAKVGSEADDSDVEPDGSDAETRDSDGDVAADTDSDAGVRPGLADFDREERVELGVDLLAHVERESLSISEAVDRIEAITTDPALTREILDTAELRGAVDREEGRILTRRGTTFVRFEEQVVRREGDYECRRCGAGLGTGHFVRFEAGELGPFGPECVRKVLGRT